MGVPLNKSSLVFSDLPTNNSTVGGSPWCQQNRRHLLAKGLREFDLRNADCRNDFDREFIYAGIIQWLLGSLRSQFQVNFKQVSYDILGYFSWFKTASTLFLFLHEHPFTSWRAGCQNFDTSRSSSHVSTSSDLMQLGFVWSSNHMDHIILRDCDILWYPQASLKISQISGW